MKEIIKTIGVLSLTISLSTLYVVTPDTTLAVYDPSPTTSVKVNPIPDKSDSTLEGEHVEMRILSTTTDTTAIESIPSVKQSNEEKEGQVLTITEGFNVLEEKSINEKMEEHTFLWIGVGGMLVLFSTLLLFRKAK